MKYIAFDTETSGLNKYEHSILTAYFAALDENLNIIDELDLYLKPDTGDIKFEERALEVTGINLAEHLKDPRTITHSQGSSLLIEFIKKHKPAGRKAKPIMLGHNIEFDIGFINQQLLSESLMQDYLHYKKLDSYQNTVFLQDCGILPPDLGNLTSMIEYFKLTKGSFHNAKEDVKMTIEVYRQLRKLMQTVSRSGGGLSADLLSVVEEI